MYRVWVKGICGCLCVDQEIDFEKREERVKILKASPRKRMECRDV